MKHATTWAVLLVGVFTLAYGACPAYDPALYVCVNGVLCPTSAPNACGTACYSSSSYSCCNGNLIQVGQTCAGTPATTPPTSPPSSSGSTAGSYNVDTVYSGQGLYDPALWDYFTGGDPTHGNVQYLGYNDAINNGLLSYTQIGTNYYRTTIKSSQGSAWGTRKAVRLSTKKKWSRGLFMLELSHMPTGCSTWPAYWLLSAGGNWPTGGEVDVLEGVNNGNKNAATLHTNQGCTQAPQTSWGNGNNFAGYWKDGKPGFKATDCWINNPNQWSNQGCSIEFPNTNSYGTGFNAINGGTYALEITDSFMKVWFFPRNTYSWQSNPNPASWGQPQAYFVLNGNCPASMFYDLQVIINLTFCGDWAGGDVFNQMCGGDCPTYIANNHGTLNANAYWDINSLTVYTK